MTMREKMARAIAAGHGITWDALPEEYFADADAALAALEVPTEAMVEAGTRAYDDGEGEYSIYRDMIRAAGE
jgi:RPA family protein